MFGWKGIWSTTKRQWDFQNSEMAIMRITVGAYGQKSLTDIRSKLRVVRAAWMSWIVVPGQRNSSMSWIQKEDLDFRFGSNSAIIMTTRKLNWHRLSLASPFCFVCCDALLSFNATEHYRAYEIETIDWLLQCFMELYVKRDRRTKSNDHCHRDKFTKQYILY